MKSVQERNALRLDVQNLEDKLRLDVQNLEDKLRRQEEIVTQCEKDKTAAASSHEAKAKELEALAARVPALEAEKVRADYTTFCLSFFFCLLCPPTARCTVCSQGICRTGS